MVPHGSAFIFLGSGKIALLFWVTIPSMMLLLAYPKIAGQSDVNKFFINHLKLLFEVSSKCHVLFPNISQLNFWATTMIIIKTPSYSLNCTPCKCIYDMHFWLDGLPSAAIIVGSGATSISCAKGLRKQAC